MHSNIADAADAINATETTEAAETTETAEEKAWKTADSDKISYLKKGMIIEEYGGGIWDG